MILGSNEHKIHWFDFHGKIVGDKDAEEEWSRVVKMHREPIKSASVYVMQSYQSPVTGKWIDTPRQRRNDLKASGSRPWEGRDAETKAAQQREKDFDKMLDKSAEKAAIEAWQSLPSETKRSLESAG
jgi:hypothetical protein